MKAHYESEPKLMDIIKALKEIAKSKARVSTYLHQQRFKQKSKRMKTIKSYTVSTMTSAVISRILYLK